MTESKPYNEDDLLSGIIRGDQQSFRQFFESQEKAILYFAEKLLGQRQEAEDMVLTSFQKLWERRSSVTALQSARSFLYTTVRNQCLNIIKHRQVVEGVHRDLPGNDSAASDYVEYRMLQGELLKQIYNEIRALPKHYSQVLEWSLLEDIPTSEIAQRLSITESSVRSARSRALVQLRNALRQKHFLGTALLFWQFLESFRGTKNIF